MTRISDLVLTFVTNALWQVALIAAVASCGAWLLRDVSAKYRHALWVSALLLSFVLPLSSLQSFKREQSGSTQPSHASGATPSNNSRPAATQFGGILPSAKPSLSLETPLAFTVIGLYVLFLLYRYSRLWQAWRRTAAIRRGAYPAAVPSSVERGLKRWQDELGIGPSPIFCSPAVGGPLTLGVWRPIVVIPEQLLAEASAQVLTAAAAHEMAHIKRRDFACNLLYELLYLPLSFHPAAVLVKRQINRTRELACDELVSEKLMDARAYACSLVSLANSASSATSVSYALGINDDNILEERVMRLINRSANRYGRFGKPLALAFVTVLCVAAVAAGSLSFRVSGSRKSQGGARQTGGTSGESTLSADSLLKGAMELNRAGHWREAAQLALEVTHMPSANHAERCEAYASEAYSYDLLKEADNALDTVKLFNNECGDLPDSSWPRQEVSRISNKLNGVVPTTAMELNRAGEWARAAEVAEGVLSAGSPTLDERCEAHVDAAYAYVRLKKQTRAAAQLKQFDEECGSLPADSWQRSEVRRLRAEVE